MVNVYGRQVVNEGSGLDPPGEGGAPSRRSSIAAERVIVKMGWGNTNFGEIARKARLSRSLESSYFPTRGELFHAVCGRRMAELQRRFALALAARYMGLDQLMAIGRAYHAFRWTSRSIFRCRRSF